MTQNDIVTQLNALRNEEYAAFQQKLIPNIDPQSIIGVKTPQLKLIAKEIAGRNTSQTFLRQLPHRYFEENQIHAFIIAGIKDYDLCIEEVSQFLPYIDNWATCDQLSPKVFARHKTELLTEIHKWIASNHLYTQRFAIGMLMRHYLDDDFKTQYLDIVAETLSDEYYLNMMRAWYFATALAKQYQPTLRLFEEKRLDKWTHNKAIQKARESYRLDSRQKDYLQTLKIK